MAITKTTEEDKIEVLGEHKDIQIRTATVLKEDGVELTRTFSRHVLTCVQSSKDGSTWTHTDTDISGESTEVKAICNAVWTTEVKNAKKAFNEANNDFTI
tara:strand:+ start:586 stop:885 length:300 start_codon:yes stop_codon:yes gene_type:complete